MMNGMMGGGFGGFGLLGWIIQLAVIIGIVYLAIVLFRNSNFSKGGSTKDNSLDILKERFAKGEITEEEYERKKKMLQS